MEFVKSTYLSFLFRVVRLVICINERAFCMKLGIFVFKMVMSDIEGRFKFLCRSCVFMI